jgi:hypothetical protein
LLAVPQLSLGAGFQSSAYTDTYADQGLAHSSGLISIQLATITSLECHPITDRKPRNKIWSNFVFLPLCGFHATSNENANRIFHSQTLHRFTAISVSQSHTFQSVSTYCFPRSGPLRKSYSSSHPRRYLLRPVIAILSNVPSTLESSTTSSIHEVYYRPMRTRSLKTIIVLALSCKNCSTYTWTCDWPAARSAGCTETTYEWKS